VLRQAVEELPEQMRQCVSLQVYQELSYGQIAVAMQLSVETVKSHLHQARQRLKAKLASYFGEREG
jgi:RNA polymerase sigma-70 factor (ECF subfamily)